MQHQIGQWCQGVCWGTPWHDAHVVHLGVLIVTAVVRGNCEVVGVQVEVVVEGVLHRCHSEGLLAWVAGATRQEHHPEVSHPEPQQLYECECCGPVGI